MRVESRGGEGWCNLQENRGGWGGVLREVSNKAARAAEETMAVARESIGLLQIGGIKGLAGKAPAESALRVPETVESAKDEEEAWEIRTTPWLERVSKTYPLKKDRPRTFITRKGRKVGVYAAAEQGGAYRFQLEDRPLNVLVLLAQAADRRLHDYVLPPKLLQDNWKKFSRNEGGVVIEMRNGINGAALVISENELPIQQYEGDYSALQ